MHDILAEFLEKLLFERFIVGHETQSEILSKHFKYKEVTEEMSETLSNLPEVIEIRNKFEIFKKQILAG